MWSRILKFIQHPLTIYHRGVGREERNKDGKLTGGRQAVGMFACQGLIKWMSMQSQSYIHILVYIKLSLSYNKGYFTVFQFASQNHLT